MGESLKPRPLTDDAHENWLGYNPQAEIIISVTIITACTSVVRVLVLEPLLSRIMLFELLRERTALRNFIERSALVLLGTICCGGDV